jgi:putative transposase
MLNEAEFKAYAASLSLSSAALELLRSVRPGPDGRPAPPARAVDSQVGNSIVRYPSQKMGFAVECESGRSEYLSALELEHDDDVQEYYSQPCRIVLRYQSPTDRKVVVSHIPDCLVLRRRAIEFRECKTQDGIAASAKLQPNRYQGDASGQWTCPPGEDAAKEYGFAYRVWTPAALAPAFAANLRFLDPFFKRPDDYFAQAVYRAVVEHVEQHQGITLDDLSIYFGSQGPALTRWMIAQGHLYCDLHRWRIAEPATALVYTSRDVGKAAERFLPEIQKWPVQLAGPAPMPAQQASSLVTSVFLQYGEAAITFANRRLSCLSGQSPAPVSARTVRRWKKAYASSQRVHGNGYLGIIPHIANRGGHKRRLPALVYQIADEVIQTFYLVTAGMKVSVAYRQFQHRCTLQQVTPVPSQVWFWSRIRSLPHADVVAARQGPRAAYQVLGGLHGTVGCLDVHGDFPFQVVHIDHTKLDLETRSEYSELGLGRCWLTAAFDAASRSVLATYLSFDDPSIVAVLMVIRDLVLRHQILPFGITVDNGPEFRSEWFEVFTALHDVLVWRRPPHRARFGALVEGFFGTNNSQFIHTLEGNTQLSKNVRQLSMSVDPAPKAIWTLPALYDAVNTYCFEHFNKRPHPDLGRTPADALTHLLQKHGVSALHRQAFDDDFLIATMVSKGTARVQPARGVKIRGDYYYHPALAGVVQQSVPVKWDPMDPGRVFCEVGGKWLPCLSKYAERVAGFSVRQVQCWAEELGARFRATKLVSGSANARLAQFIHQLKTVKEPELRRQYERALANRDVLAKAKILPKDTPTQPVQPSSTAPGSVVSDTALAQSIFGAFTEDTFPTGQLPQPLA